MYKCSGSKDLTLQTLLKTYKAHLRNLEMFQLEKLNRSKSFHLDRPMYENRNNFLEKINAHRRTMANFSKFHRKLFSHVDRPNSLGQDNVERNVKRHYESI